VLSIEATVISAQPDPLRRDRLRRWLVRCRVDRVVEGALPADAAELDVLIHSPSRAFADVDIIGKTYRLDFVDALEWPYAGELQVEPAE
jgi:hypothetical protein